MNHISDIRSKIIEVSYRAGACHIGSSLSCIDIIIDIYKKKKKKDLFVFSKASGVCALYSYLYSTKRAIKLLKKYPLASKEAGLIFSTGSLGHGLPFATGLAFSDRSRDVYVLLGDAEMQEGTFYESLLFKNQHNLDNLKVYVDMNGLQALGKVYDILSVPHWLAECMGVNLIKTVKGQGVKILEDMGFKNHYYNLTEDGFTKAIFQINSEKSKKR
jgi:transketolase